MWAAGERIEADVGAAAVVEAVKVVALILEMAIVAVAAADGDGMAV